VTLRRVLVELTVTEQRYRVVLEVQAGVPVRTLVGSRRRADSMECQTPLLGSPPCENS
jgi:hypothetical protein